LFYVIRRLSSVHCGKNNSRQFVKFASNRLIPEGGYQMTDDGGRMVEEGGFQPPRIALYLDSFGRVWVAIRADFGPTQKGFATKHFDSITKRRDSEAKHFDAMTKHFDSVTKHFDSVTKHFDSVTKQSDSEAKHFTL
jgi:tRNA-dihydrouridine synthase